MNCIKVGCTSAASTCLKQLCSFGCTLGPVDDCTSIKIDRGGQPNSGQIEPKGELPDLFGKQIRLCLNCQPLLQCVATTAQKSQEIDLLSRTKYPEVAERDERIK